MRIGIEAQRIFRDKKHGMDIVALELIKALQQIDNTNEYFIFVKKGNDNTCIEPTDNFHIIEVPGLTYADWEQVFLPYYAFLCDIDLLHCTSNTAPLLCPVPTIITLHDVIFLEQQQSKSKSTNWYQQLGRIYRQFIVPGSIRRTQRIITVSNYEKTKISDTLKIANDKISVVYNAFGKHFNINADSAQVNRIREQYHLPEHYIFYIGNTDPKKNMPTTLNAYAKYVASTENHLPLVIADVNEATLNAYLDKGGLQSLRPHLQLTGYIYNRDLPFIYAGAAVFLYPSLRESFGIPLLESMACGTPVITSNTSALPEVAGNAALLVNPESESEIIDALKKAITNQPLRNDLKQKGWERIRQFNWNNSANNLLNIYTTL